MPYSATDLYNAELIRLQQKQQNTDAILNSQDRLAMLNDSYRKRYAKYVQILIVLVSAVLVYLGVVLLQKQFPAIPQVVVDIVTIVLVFLIIFYLFSVGTELYSRSLLNYDELDIPSYDASGVDISALAEKGQIFSSHGTTSPICVGEACCKSGSTYDAPSNRCAFTTYTDAKFDSPSLKREPISYNVTPLQHVTVLTYSNV